jgi:ParB family chromosome partitioning protein
MTQTPPTRRALGRGLAALIPGAAGATTTEEEATDTSVSRETGLKWLPIEDLVPNPEQPRKHFDPDGLQELSESIKEQGVLQPIIVNKSDEGYLIVAGERRWRASALAGIQSVPVLVKELSAEDILKVALIENIQRRDLDPIEEALAYKRLLEQHSLTQENLAESLGKNRATIANSLRLLKLPTSILELIGRGSLSAGHAKAILTLDDETSMQKLADSVMKQGLSVRDAEARARGMKRAKVQEEGPADSAELPSDLASRGVEDRLARLLGTKVRLVDRRGKGRIEIHYHSLEHLDGLLDKFEMM